MVILHGLFGMLDNWRTIARKLEASWQCILVDLRNHGKSPHDPEMNYSVMAADVMELINDLDISPAIVIGHSMGGKVAMELALTYPKSVQKLIVIDIAPRQYPPHHEKVIIAIESVDPEKMKERSEAEHLLRSHLGEDESTIQFLLKNISRRQEGGFEWKANMAGIIAEYDAVMDRINPDRSFDKPVLFVRGINSNSLNEKDLPDIKSLFPNVEWLTIADAGHWVHSDQPEALTEALIAFMNA